MMKWAGQIYTITLENLVPAVDDPNHLGACRGTVSSLFNAEAFPPFAGCASRS
jgi:hypothetical protein